MIYQIHHIKSQSNNIILIPSSIIKINQCELSIKRTTKSLSLTVKYSNHHFSTRNNFRTCKEIKEFIQYIQNWRANTKVAITFFSKKIEEL